MAREAQDRRSAEIHTIRTELDVREEVPFFPY